MTVASNKQQHKEKHIKKQRGRKKKTQKRKTKHRETDCRGKNRPSGLTEAPHL
jgi:hypothetical protein